MATLGSTGVTLIDQVLNDPEARAAASRGPDATAPRLRSRRWHGRRGHPTFAQVDFGLVRDRDGCAHRNWSSCGVCIAVGFQLAVAEAYRDAFGLPASLDLYLDGLTPIATTRSWPTRCRRSRSRRGGADGNPAASAKTWPDFVVTEQMWGVRAVDTAEVTREGKRLYYRRDGKVTQIKRIYNRVIPDELERKGIQLSFGYGDDLEVQWAGHPAWYFRLSKFSIPFLRHPSVPETRFLDGIEQLPIDRERYLLKPLFSFAGGGIMFAPTDAQIAAIPREERKNYILQERIAFEPVIDTPEGPTQVEIRIMYLRDPSTSLRASGSGLRPVLPLLRMGRGKMMGVDHNKAYVGLAPAGLISQQD